jgi:nitrous oxidase accessory protein NosD
MLRSMIWRLVIGLSLMSFSPAVSAAVLGVPRDFATIQQAADAAAVGDEIRVGPGRHCGAIIDKRLVLRGIGNPVIVGCETGPVFPTGARLGFFLPGTAGTSAAGGTQIHGFVFDGRGVSSANLTPIAFGVFGRFAHDVHVMNNRFLGTVQAVTNTGGDRWFIWNNRVEELTLFDCSGLCSGGDAIVIQIPSASMAAPGGNAAPANRPEQNVIVGNRISGSLPDNFDDFGMVGILVFAADRTLVSHNSIAIPDNPLADAQGHGVVVTNTCCGELTPALPGARNSVILFNDARRSEVGFFVEGSGGQNTQGLVLLHNRGSVVIEGTVQAEADGLRALSRGALSSKQRYF